MRVAIFTDSYLPTVDGVVNSIRGLKGQLEALGHSVLVLAPGGWHNGTCDDGDTLLCRARELRRYPGYRMAFIPSRREVRFLEDKGIDLVHSHGIAFMALKGMWAARELGVPLAETYHTNILQAMPYYAGCARSRTAQRLMALYLRHFLHHCGGVVAPSRAALQQLETLAPRMRRTRVIPNGVDLQRFNPLVRGDGVRAAFDLGRRDVILYVGRVAPEKGLDLLLDAFANLRRSRPDARLLIVGRGPSLGHYMASARRRFPWRGVTFTGFVPDRRLPEFYAACDVFALPSTFETQGMVLLEAMACGKPVVALDHGAIPEVVRNGENGYLAVPGDPRAFALGLDAALRAGGEMGGAARATAQAFSQEAAARRTEALYHVLLAEFS